MRAFLRIADALQESDEELRVFVRQVRDISEDAEDLLAEYVLLQGHNHEPGMYGSLYRLACCVKNAKACYRIINELKTVNCRLKTIGDVYKRLHVKFSRGVEPGSRPMSIWQDSRNDALLFHESDLVGIGGRKKQLVEWLIGGEVRRKVVSLVGLGGIGKTTLAKQAYEDSEVKKVFKVRVWVSVSQSFKIEDLLTGMVRQLYRAIRRRVPQEVEKMTVNQQKMMIKEMLRKQRYLIVLDDVWNPSAWLSVQYALPNSSLGSRVMLTTRNFDVASIASIDSHGKTYNLEPLPPMESWDLLCRKTFQGTPCPFHLEEICKYILKKCEGLPLAIVAISGVLATKDTRRIDEWDMVARSLGAEIESNDKLMELKKVLSLSFDDLPYNLKSCFLYLSVFPEDHLIDRMRLIRLWVAEGFVESREDKVLEDIAEEYLNDLLCRNLIQVATTTSDGRVKTLRIHNLLQEIIISKSRDQNFATVVKGQTVQWSKRSRRLSVHSILQQPNMSVSHLRSLFVFEVPDKLHLNRLFPDGFKLLTVLDLQSSYITKFPVEIVNLYYLKYLSLRDTKVKTVPRFIAKLQNLETLDLKDSHVSELPVEILMLKRLRHLLVYRTEFVSNQYFSPRSGFKIMGSLGALQFLQKLCFVEANNQGGGTMLIELRNLNQLRKLGILKLRQEDGEFLCSSIEKLKNLRALSIASMEDELIDLQHLSTPPVLLQRLYIKGRLETIPHWIPSMHSLVKLYLQWSKLKENPLAKLECMPSLVHLVLCQAFTAERLCFRAGGFKKLKILVLEDFDELRCIQVEAGAMEFLEDLSIRRCKLLKKVPIGIEHLEKLKLVEFSDMPAELFGTIYSNVKDSEHWRVKHIPEIYSTYWREGKWKVYSLESMSDGENFPLPISSLKTHERWK